MSKWRTLLETGVVVVAAIVAVVAVVRVAQWLRHLVLSSLLGAGDMR